MAAKLVTLSFHCFCDQPIGRNIRDFPKWQKQHTFCVTDGYSERDYTFLPSLGHQKVTLTMTSESQIQIKENWQIFWCLIIKAKKCCTELLIQRRCWSMKVTRILWIIKNETMTMTIDLRMKENFASQFWPSHHHVNLSWFSSHGWFSMLLLSSSLLRLATIDDVLV